MTEFIEELFLVRLVKVLRSEPRILAAWLLGSYARETADAYSDIDLWIVVDPEAKAAFVDDWPAISDRVAPSVLRQWVFGSTFLHISPDWQRWDVSIGVPDDVAHRTRSTVKPLFDRAGLNDRLLPPGDPQAPDPVKISALTTEFLRVLGLLPVVLGRGEFLVGAAGADLLRGLIVQLFREEVAVEDRGGALHINALFSERRLTELSGLPAFEASYDGVFDAHMACARIFLPAARELAAASGATWPSELEEALRRRLRRELRINLP